MAWHRVALQNTLEVGQKTVREIDGREILICRLGEKYYAVANRCTHAAWPLADEPIEGLEILCTMHGARFDLRDGCPTRGPAHKPLATFPVEDRDGDLYVSF